MIDNKILDITQDVKWIGVLDYDIRTFDIVMETKFGTTYNSYFINAQKKTIVETAKVKFWETYINKIKQITNPTEIEYIIVNHTEPDHSGSIKKLLDVAPKAIVVGSGNAIRYLNDLLGIEFKHLVVKDGDILDLGNKTIKFIAAPNLHWPDSIYSYLQEDKVLFTCDSFGAHYCQEEMYDDKVQNFDEAFKYYFDVILKPFSKFMLKAIEKIRPLDIKAICTGHGPLLTSNWQKYVDLSESYAKKYLEKSSIKKVFIAYVSAYQNTKLIAEKIAEGIKQAGNLEVEVCDIEKMSLAEIDLKIEQCSGIILGSPTINQNILLQIYQTFALISPIRDKGKLAGAFGSYGWSGEGSKMIETNLRNLKLKFIGEPMQFKFTPHEAEAFKCIGYGKEFGKQIIDCNIE
ncbi:MAG: MBL fold metallo-hydrolase [Bacteroidetes bacterium CG2_30_32_10]|nr:MAG: MBL fold metallo-hydrolase [Bacteroidetes bacterium CG2_30_32_10]